MSILQHLLQRASAVVGATGAAPGQPSSPSGALRTLNDLFLGRPASVMQVLVFRDQELLYHKLYDPSTQMLAEPGRQLMAVHGVLDFMRDTFGPQSNHVSYEVGRWQITGLVEGPYTLVAVTKAGTDPARVARWLQDLRDKLPHQAR